jgi:hypothetical protein
LDGRKWAAEMTLEDDDFAPLLLYMDAQVKEYEETKKICPIERAREILAEKL